MTNKEVYDFLYDYKMKNLNYMNSEMYDVLNEALFIIEKRVPKKVFDKKKLSKNLSIGVCPDCENGVNSEMSYCDICGKKLNWN